MNNEPSLLTRMYYFIKIKNRWVGIDELIYEEQFKDFDRNMLINAAQELMDLGALKPNTDVNNVSLYTKMMATTDYFSLDDFIKAATPLSANEMKNKSRAKSFIEIVSWIVGIISSLIAIYLFANR